MARSKAQAVRTEALFRSVNEHIADAAVTRLVEEAHFVCECADPACAERIHAPLDEYDDVRSAPGRFLVKPGHSDLSVERVVSVDDAYEVVEKDLPKRGPDAA